MTRPDLNMPPPGSGAVHWFLFLAFFHLIPVPWFLAVAGGLAPASFLFCAGMASLFLTDGDSLAFGAMLLAPALVGGLAFYLAAWLIAVLVIRLQRPVVRTITLVVLLTVCLLVAMNPVFVYGGHSRSGAFSLFDFIRVLGEFRIRTLVSGAYFSGLAILMLALLVYQHRATRLPAIPARTWLRYRRIRRWLLTGGLLILLAAFCWTHRILLVVNPLAALDVASAQYRLALAVKGRSRAPDGSDVGYHDWLVRAAEQGHVEAALQLVEYPRSREEKLRWLTVAAEANAAPAQYQLYLVMLNSNPGSVAAGKARAWLEKAANQGDPQLQHEVGGIFLFGRHGLEIDLPRGRGWWAKALEQTHIKTMETVAPAYQNGRFGYPVDLLKSKALVKRIVDAYRDGRYGVDPDPIKARYWRDELRYFDRLFELAGGSYESPDVLERKAEAGDLQAQYQLGRQSMVSAPKKYRRQGLAWIERAADGGHAEAQYRLVTYFERQAGIMRNNPVRGVALLLSAAEQNHLPAMGTLALAYYKGRYGLNRDYRIAKNWYERLLQAYESGNYLGEIDERFRKPN